jgi:hypothetical protein
MSYRMKRRKQFYPLLRFDDPLLHRLYHVPMMKNPRDIHCRVVDVFLNAIYFYSRSVPVFNAES